jgi:hypothetical protein
MVHRHPGEAVTAPKKAPDTDGNLPEARRLLDHAISALIDPKPHTVHRENRTTEITWLDSLYDHLLDAVAGQSGERSGGQSSIPIWADVLDLLHRIESDIRKWQPAEQAEFIGPLRPGWCRLDVNEPPTITRLAAIQSRGWRPQDVADIVRIVGKIEDWCDEIRAKLSPRAGDLPDVPQHVRGCRVHGVRHPVRVPPRHLRQQPAGTPTRPESHQGRLPLPVLPRLLGTRPTPPPGRRPRLPPTRGGARVTVQDLDAHIPAMPKQRPPARRVEDIPARWRERTDSSATRPAHGKDDPTGRCATTSAATPSRTPSRLITRGSTSRRNEPRLAWILW